VCCRGFKGCIGGDGTRHTPDCIASGVTQPVPGRHKNKRPKTPPAADRAAPAGGPEPPRAPVAKPGPTPRAIKPEPASEPWAPTVII
jgi:hypothetical protein